ncbi:MAG: hypothetical protein A2284_05830 [Deltaproteobacteria bacterium RIFOXYA12_FULL_61_11]|nr:MAG: hypothetical protein A2284_05830 [Deltaproteobacteria bacterium RIFOXYA12_FULL_61_11]
MPVVGAWVVVGVSDIFPSSATALGYSARYNPGVPSVLLWARGEGETWMVGIIEQLGEITLEKFFHWDSYHTSRQGEEHGLRGFMISE